MDLEITEEHNSPATSNFISVDHNRQLTSTISTPLQRIENAHVENKSISSASSHQHTISGEVSHTPTNSSFTPLLVNPHSSMNAMTPVASGPNLAKNSIKLQ